MIWGTFTQEILWWAFSFLWACRNARLVVKTLLPKRHKSHAWTSLISVKTPLEVFFFPSSSLFFFVQQIAALEFTVKIIQPDKVRVNYSWGCTEPLLLCDRGLHNQSEMQMVSFPQAKVSDSLNLHPLSKYIGFFLSEGPRRQNTRAKPNQGSSVKHYTIANKLWTRGLALKPWTHKCKTTWLVRKHPFSTGEMEWVGGKGLLESIKRRWRGLESLQRGKRASFRSPFAHKWVHQPVPRAALVRRAIQFDTFSSEVDPAAALRRVQTPSSIATVGCVNVNLYSWKIACVCVCVRVWSIL